ncbi:MAG: cytochrome c oxidase subunit 3 [Anaerolineae bacterium]
MTLKQNSMDRPMSREEQIALKNKRTGITIFQISWILVFVCLVVVYFQMRSEQATWPPAGVQPAALLPGVLATVALLASTVLVWRGMKRARAASLPGLAQQWTIGLALGAAFVVVVGAQWFMTPGDNPYGMVFRVMVGYHLLHAIVIGAYMITILRSVRAGHVSTRDLWPVEAGARLWYFVLAAWVLFFVPLYLV